MSSFGPDSVTLPVGTTAGRPASPSTGLIRYNSTEGGIEFYTPSGWKVSKAPIGSAENPASNGNEIYNSGQTTTGIYWLTSAGTGDFEALIKQDYGGGWINMTPTMGTMTTALTSAYGTGGSNMLVSASTNPLLPIDCGLSTHNQAYTYGCGGSSGSSSISLNSTFATAFNISEVRIKLYYAGDDGNVTCGPYWVSNLSSRTIISGTSIQVDGTCNNTPNRYSDLVGSKFTVEWYGTLSSATLLLESWTACGGEMTFQVKEIYVR